MHAYEVVVLELLIIKILFPFQDLALYSHLLSRFHSSLILIISNFLGSTVQLSVCNCVEAEYFDQH